MCPRRSRKPAPSISIGDLAARAAVPLGDQLMLSTYTSRFVINALRRAYRLFDGDLTLFLVFGEITQYNIARALRTLNFQDTSEPARWKGLMRTLQQQKVTPCNALSISEATGIPRETVRRKVKELEERGWLYREGARSLTLAPAAIEQLSQSEEEIMEDFRETARVIRLLEDALASQEKHLASSRPSREKPG